MKIKKVHCFFDHRKEKGVCSEKRSLIYIEYARNFIADYVLGISSKPGLMQQIDLFTP